MGGAAMTNPTLPTISPTDLQVLKAAVRRAVFDLAGEDLDARCRLSNEVYGKIFRRYGVARLRDLPAAAFGDAVVWLKEQARPTPCTGLESRVAEARAALRAATNGLYQYRLALQGLRRAGEELQSVLQDSLALSGNGPAWAADALHLATAGGFIDLEAELLRLKDRAEAHALALVRLARSLEQQGVHHD